MSYKLSIFTTATRPEERGDTFLESLRCYKELADEVIITGQDWPVEFSWEYIGQQMTKGYELSTGDWCIKVDLDYIFHQRDFGKIRQALKDYPSAPAVSFYKHQYILPDRYNLKSRLVIAANKKIFGDRIKFDSGGDLCNMSLDGKELELSETPQAGVAFNNYDFLCKTKEQVIDDITRMDRAYNRHFGKWLYSKDGSAESAYENWLNMMIGRYHRPSRRVKLEEHPRYIQETIKNLRPDQCGHSLFGNVERCSYYA